MITYKRLQWELPLAEVCAGTTSPSAKCLSWSCGLIAAELTVKPLQSEALKVPVSYKETSAARDSSAGSLLLSIDRKALEVLFYQL